MSVASPVIDYIDGPNRIIYLLSGIVTWNPVDDIYTEVRNLRRLDENLRKYDLFCEALPLIDKGGGKTTGRALRLLGGTRITPFDETASITITGELLSDEGLSGISLINITPLTPLDTILKISYEPPPSTEVVTVNTGGGTFTDADRTTIETARDHARASNAQTQGT